MFNNEPNFFSVIPGSVRYSKDLSPMEKIFFSELSALTNEFGFCFASNSYFVDLYKVSSRTVQRWIEKLSKLGFIVVSFDSGTRRRSIYLSFVYYSSSSSPLNEEDNKKAETLYNSIKR